FLLYFFFFQAEDGIRYRNVTGVQTCALPIFYTNNYYDFVENGNKKRTENDAILLFENKILIVEIKAGAISNSSISNDFKSFENRSEERRVGKECRSRWTMYHEYKER